MELCFESHRGQVAQPCKHALLTLARDGSVLFTFTDHALDTPKGVHVTHAGRFLVCELTARTILQVDSEGRNQPPTRATQDDGVLSTFSVCYNRHTAFNIVGISRNNSILIVTVEKQNLTCILIFSSDDLNCSWILFV
ncbi:hypothetical protein DPMN_162071 [Dreissena polymorpha]|uniref:Uncharacterized protein n=1 Tax=Dreissena polymorpha TaxID=45954 RepID=A0A9D4EPX8_DREPO|nr:hypothetical protein DPMN_162071 [Dreissena polymorpha]